MKHKLVVLAAAAILTAAPLAATLKSSSPLLTAHQAEIQTLALSLRDDPAVKAARTAAIQRFGQAPPIATADGKATLNAALDELFYGVLLAAAGNDPANPKVVWTESLPYASGKLAVPGARYGGDNPDRIYRSVAANPAYRYEIRGQRNAAYPSLDFSFEAIPLPSIWGQATAALQAKDIEVAKDGSFTITADATPANGRRNHLQLPAGTATILLRDTLADWKQQLPNELSVRRLDAPPASPRSRAALTQDAAAQLDSTIDKTLKFLDSVVWSKPANQLTAFERTLAWGVPGGVLAINRFSLQDDEALLITLDPISAKYLAVQLTDPWLRSAAYQDRSTSLSNLQAKSNADASISYVLSLKDPGIYNWLDTGGLHDGVVLVRWELLSRPAELKKAVRETRKIKLSELAAALPAGTLHVTPAERKQLLAARQAAYGLRIAQR